MSHSMKTSDVSSISLFKTTIGEDWGERELSIKKKEKKEKESGKLLFSDFKS